jgi:hypothetical protein
VSSNELITKPVDTEARVPRIQALLGASRARVQVFLTGFAHVSRQTLNRVSGKLLPFVRTPHVYRVDSNQSVNLVGILRARYVE